MTSGYSFRDIVFEGKETLCRPFMDGVQGSTSRLEPLQEGSLLFTTNFPEIPGTHFIDLGMMTD